jgi:hypothetical protein
MRWVATCTTELRWLSRYSGREEKKRKISMPPNSFILFSRDRCRETAAEYPHERNQQIITRWATYTTERRWLCRYKGGGGEKSWKIHRPPNAFILFTRERRREVAAENPSERNNQISTQGVATYTTELRWLSR